MIIVWGRTSSVNVQKVLWCLAELGVPHERIEAGLQYGKNDEDWFLAMNPNGRVPVIKDGALTLWESNTIVRYLCASHTPNALYPESPGRRADAERWMDWQLSTLAPPVSTAYHGLVRTAPAERNVAAIERAVKEANRAFSLLDRHLGTRRYVAGDGLTMGDIPVGALAYRWLALDGIERPELQHLRRWHDELALREPFRHHVMLPLT